MAGIPRLPHGAVRGRADLQGFADRPVDVLARQASDTVATDIPVYFADPKSPWQRGTNENTNGLLCHYFPKGTDLSRWTAEEIQAVAATLNNRPRKTLGWKTPAEALYEHLLCARQPGVATTD